ncbi:MAG: response regulator, partial [Oscillospiraceae bacterium]|nr:response regulator [Oscillospiraceae bacterium]
MRSKKTVLLINNSQVFMDLTKRVLERAGYAVRCAAGDSEAHEQMEEFVPDAIILDSDLPEGFECFQSPIMETPVPMMILSSDKNCELQALQSGAVDFMKKPFDFEIMKARLALMLKEPPAQPETEGDQRDNGAAAGEGQSESVAALEAQKTQKKTFKFRYLYIAAACMVLVL